MSENGLEKFYKHLVERGRERYEAGDKSQLLYWLDYFLRHNEPVPDRIRQGFNKAYSAIRWLKVDSWDEVFGHPLKGKRPKALRKRMEIADPIFERVCELHGVGERLDTELFEKVGREFGVGSTLAKELYYEIRKDFEEDEELLNKFLFPGK